jgi:regulator of sirC expression with transglutaminase-like and TPR domain
VSTPDLRYRDHLGDAHARLALSRLVSEDPDAFPLDEAVLLLALDERPDVDLTTTRERLDRLADRIHLRPGTSLQEAVARLAIGLFGEGRLQGDTETYDDPQNSDLPRVLERQRGLPILLSIVMLGVARRLDLPLAGVSFPGHFLVGPAHGALEASGMTHKRSFWLDPFHGGRVLSEVDLRRSLKRNFPHAPNPSPEDWDRLTGPAHPLQVLIRVNQNLKRAWAKRKDSAGALRAIDRILLLTPDAWPQHRDRGLLLARIGAHRDARAALTTYLAHAPEASDAPRISMILSSLHMQVG